MANTDEPKGIMRIFYRSYTYFVQGYSFVSIPFTVLGLSSAIFVALKDVGFLSWLHYSDFVIAIFTIGVPFTTTLGWWVYHKSHFYAQQQVVQQESSPYSYDKLTPIAILSWKVNRELMRQQGKMELVEQITTLLKKNGVED